MKKQLNIAEQEELFRAECKLINLKYEYPGYTGTKKWAVVSELSEKELLEKYPDVISRYTPFLLLSFEVGKAITDFHNNEDKHHKRMVRSVDIYGYDDELTSQFHEGLCTYDELPFEAKERMEKEALREKQKILIREGMSILTETQKRRLKAVYYDGKTSRQVAAEEGVNYSKIDKSVMQALKKLKAFLENRGCKT